MGKVRVRGFTVSINGFGAGPDQGLEHPLGKRVEAKPKLGSLGKATLVRDVARGGRPAESVAGCSSNRLLLLGRRYAARLGLGLGLGQESEARLAPPEINAYIQQSIGTSAWAGKFHDRGDTVGLPGSQGHRPPRCMVRGGIDAQNQITGADRVAHSFHP
jgi:hypothetical protein